MRVSAKQRERGETLRDGTALCCSKENRHSTKSEDEFLNFGGNLLEFKLDIVLTTTRTTRNQIRLNVQHKEGFDEK